jgi:hypothetical protein
LAYIYTLASSTRNRTTLTFPDWTAKCRGVIPSFSLHVERIENPALLEIAQLAGPVTAVHSSLYFLDYSRVFYTEPSRLLPAI